MSVRPPSLGRGESIFDPLNTEILGEKAAALGRAGEKVESTLAALRAHDGRDAAREKLVSAASHAVFAYFVQRELCGLRRHDDIIREYAIPREVLVRLGAG